MLLVIVRAVFKCNRALTGRASCRGFILLVVLPLYTLYILLYAIRYTLLEVVDTINIMILGDGIVRCLATILPGPALSGSHSGLWVWVGGVLHHLCGQLFDAAVEQRGVLFTKLLGNGRQHHQSRCITGRHAISGHQICAQFCQKRVNADRGFAHIKSSLIHSMLYLCRSSIEHSCFRTEKPFR